MTSANRENDRTIKSNDQTINFAYHVNIGFYRKSAAPKMPSDRIYRRHYCALVLATSFLLALLMPTSSALAQYGEAPDVHIVSIGIDEYSDGYAAFRGAVRDARVLADSLERAVNPFARSTNTTMLLNRDASRDRIEVALREAAAVTTESDLFILTFAGHGRQIVTSDTTAEHFLVLSDTPAHSDDDLATHRSNSIPARLLKTWLDVIPARNQLIVVDAAYGHQFFHELLTIVESTYEDDQEDGLLNSNLAVLAFRDLAPEIRLPDGRSHGALTYSILDALHSLSTSGDGVGTVWELGEEVMQRYPQIVEQYAAGWSGGAARFFLSGDYYAIASTSAPLAVRAAQSLFGTDNPRLPRPISITSEVPGAAFDTTSGVRVRVGSARVRPPAFFDKPQLVYSVTGRVSPDVDTLLVNGRPVIPAFSGSFSVPISGDALQDSLKLVARSPGGESTMLLPPPATTRGAVGATRPGSNRRVGRTGRDVALVFATGTYDHWSPLTNPAFDADALAEELTTSYGFDVTVIHDATRTQMRDSLSAFANADVGPDGQLLVFFAGHGSYDEDNIQDGYVVASNSQPAASDTYKDSMVQYNWIRRRLASARANHVLLVLDVCFGGTFAGVLGSATDRSDASMYASLSGEELVARKLQHRTRRYITSGGKERVPDGLPGEHTPFVRSLLEALRTYGGSDGVLTLAEIFSHIESVQPEPRAGEFERNEPGSDFVFVAQ